MSDQDEVVTVTLPRALWAQIRDFATKHPLRPSARKMLADLVRRGLKVMADASEEKKVLDFVAGNQSLSPREHRMFAEIMLRGLKTEYAEIEGKKEKSADGEERPKGGVFAKYCQQQEGKKS